MVQALVQDYSKETILTGTRIGKSARRCMMSQSFFYGDACLGQLRIAGLLCLFALSVPLSLRAQENRLIAIMPAPAHVLLGDGRFPIDGEFAIALQG